MLRFGSMSAESPPPKVVALADTSPATVTTAQQGNVSPVGTEHFASYPSSEASSDVVLPNVIPPRGTPLPPVGWQEGDPSWEPPKKVAKPVPETPPKTKLPED